MKLVKQIVAILCVTFVSLQSYGQLSIGGQLSYLSLSGWDGGNLGLGLKVDYGDDKMVYTGGLSYYLPSKINNSFTAHALSNQTTPEKITVNSVEKISFINLYAGLKYYFKGDYESSFGLYGIGEVGLLLAPSSSTVDDYDRVNYTSTYNEDDLLLGNFTLNLGVGIEKELNFGYLFADLKMHLPASQVQGQDVTTTIPTAFTVNLGFRKPF